MTPAKNTLPAGWAADAAAPANVATNGGNLALAEGQISAEAGDGTSIVLGPNYIAASGPNGSAFSIDPYNGFISVPAAGGAAYRVDPAHGGGGIAPKVALDCGGLPIVQLPSSDPHIAGALWNDSGTPAISAG